MRAEALVQSWSIQAAPSRSGLFLNKRDVVFHPSEHTLLTATKTLALAGRQAPRTLLPLRQDLELHFPRQRPMHNNVLRFRKKGFEVLQDRFDVEFSRGLRHWSTLPCRARRLSPERELNPWRISVGQGIGRALQIQSRRGWLAFRSQHRTIHWLRTSALTIACHGTPPNEATPAN